jgi:uncharacterized protein
LVVATVALLLGIVYRLAGLTPADMSTLRTQLTPGTLGTLAIVESCALLVATAVMSRIERQSWLDYGLSGRRAPILFGQGALWGTLSMAALVGILALSHAIKINLSGSGMRSLVESGLLWAAVLVPGAFVEELMFRGYPFLRLAQTGNPKRAAIVMSVCFGLAHLGNKQETAIGILQVISVGLVYCFAVWRTGSVWWGLGAHSAWNWTQSFVFGCANSGFITSSQGPLLSVPSGPAWLSGGATGPEGSIVSLPVMALLAWIALHTLPNERRAREWPLSTAP